jgi:uncharacterized damage-inducible protein DinB
MIKSFSDEYQRYKILAQKSLDQVSDEALNRVVAADGNSIAMLVRHISGNLISRFTDFLTTDGEKSWRDRDAEFQDQKYNREETERLWAAGWEVLESQLAQLSDADLEKTVYIRQQPLTVHEALSRSVAHTAYHVGQIVLLARLLTEGEWRWLSVPKGTSQEYNKNPTLEKKPA